MRACLFSNAKDFIMKQKNYAIIYIVNMHKILLNISVFFQTLPDMRRIITLQLRIYFQNLLHVLYMLSLQNAECFDFNKLYSSEFLKFFKQKYSNYRAPGKKQPQHNIFKNKATLCLTSGN